ncbi:MAG TPA: formimidoylglutamate deiminase [Alphaproteobacteria bacterium]|nr:formimidoylglutamate deiminase [Alphaproteobacteria bacterium]
MTAYFTENALLPTGWASDVRIEIDGTGAVAAVTPGAEPADAERLRGPVVPGMPNLHSHAFQRAMAGLAERAGGADGDDFWTWRETMYRFLARLGPEEVEAVAAQLYLEMLKAGYTAVGEFHYLHHQPGGEPYADRAELSHRAIAAARRVGIAITHLPVLYACGGFGGKPIGEGQRRFFNTPDDLLAMTAALRARYRDDPEVRIGAAPHSLRAVTPEMLAALVAGVQAEDAMTPIHIHVAEQIREVDDCLAWSGARPVEWLLGRAPVDGRWCLIHATHMTPSETTALAASDAVAGLCPTTEANLGDGLFDLGRYAEADGKLGIGSDSHISVSPVEELRWLEYGQRLARRARAVARVDGPSIGAGLWRQAVSGGAQALGRDTGRIEPGRRADLLVLDADSPLLYGRSGDVLLDALVFAGNTNPVRDVMVGGRWAVRDGRHPAEAEVARAYRQAIDGLAG